MDMSMRSAVPDWLMPVAWTYISLSLLSVAFIAADIYLLRRRHRIVATELVWVTSALYLGPFALAVHLRRGRANPTSTTVTSGMAERAEGTAVAVLPGGGASAVAHLIVVPLVVAVGWTIAGLAMWPMILVIAVLATVMLAILSGQQAVPPGPGAPVAYPLGLPSRLPSSPSPRSTSAWSVGCSCCTSTI